MMLAEVAEFPLARRRLMLASVAGVPVAESISYDTLVVAGGSSYAYFGHDEWREHAAEVKSLESALVARGRILRAFEAAENETDADRRAAWLTFAVVGAGPTGVEIAGQIAELARDTLPSEFRTSDPGGARILLIEMADRVLTAFSPSLSDKALRSLRRLGVTPMLGSRVVEIDAESVTVRGVSGAEQRIAARTVVWAAGVTASRLAARLAELTGTELDRAGRLTVEQDLTLPGYSEVFALGDMVRVAPATARSPRCRGSRPWRCSRDATSAHVIAQRLAGRPAPARFRYRTRATSRRSAASPPWRRRGIAPVGPDRLAGVAVRASLVPRRL